MKKNIFTELLFWKQKKLISTEQYQTMKEHYDKEEKQIAKQEHGATSSRFIAIMSIV